MSITVDTLNDHILESTEYSRKMLAGVLPKDQVTLRQWLLTVLRRKGTAANETRKSLGLPSGSEASDAAKLVTRNTPFAKALEKLFVRRLFYILRHVANANEEVKTLLDPELKANLKYSLSLLREYPQWPEPHFLQFLPVLRGKAEFPFGEGIVDPNLFTLIRSFLAYRNEKAGFGQKVPENHNSIVLDYLLSFVKDVLDKNREADEHANISWALAVAFRISPSKSEHLLRRYLLEWVDLQSPREEIRQIALLPEIFVPLRTISFELINLARIANQVFTEHTDPLHLHTELAAAIGRSAHRMLRQIDAGLPKNLYLATNLVMALHQLRDSLFMFKACESFAADEIDLDSYCPVHGYVCTDRPMEKHIREIVQRIRTHLDGNHPERLPILIYGPSGSGKSHLVKSIFAHFGKSSFFVNDQVKAPTIQTIAKLVNNQQSGFLFFDEIDAPQGNNVFSSLLTLIDDGIAHGASKPINKAVLFFAGSTFERASVFEKHLQKHREDKWEKGIDWFNRCRGNLIKLPGNPFTDSFAWLILTALLLSNHWGRPCQIEMRSLVNLARSVEASAANTRDILLRCKDGLTKVGQTLALPTLGGGRIVRLI